MIAPVDTNSPSKSVHPSSADNSPKSYITWLPPVVGFYKMNIDVAYDAEGAIIGLKAVVQNYFEDMIAAFLKSLRDSTTLSSLNSTALKMALLSFQTITINTYKYNNNGGLLPSLSFSSNAISNLNKSYSHSNSCNKAYAFSINYYNNNNNNNRPFFHQPLDHHKIFSPKRTGLLLVPFNANNDSEPEGEGTGGHEEDMNAVETVLQRLYSTIKSKKVHELSDLQQVLDFFLRAIITLGNHIEFVVKPTLQDGMNVGIKWKLESYKIRDEYNEKAEFSLNLQGQRQTTR
ncbi:hypothetical protein CsatB_012615 [Cannabis sativa]